MVSRNMNIKCTSEKKKCTSGDSFINDRHVFGHWRRCHSDIQWQSIELCSIIGKKVELVNNALEYLVTEIYNQSVRKCKKYKLSTRAPAPGDMENSLPVQTVCLEGRPSVWLDNLLKD